MLHPCHPLLGRRRVVVKKNDAGGKPVLRTTMGVTGQDAGHRDRLSIDVVNEHKDDRRTRRIGHRIDFLPRLLTEQPADYQRSQWLTDLRP